MSTIHCPTCHKCFFNSQSLSKHFAHSPLCASHLPIDSSTLTNATLPPKPQFDADNQMDSDSEEQISWNGVPSTPNKSSHQFLSPRKIKPVILHPSSPFERTLPDRNSKSTDHGFNKYIGSLKPISVTDAKQSILSHKPSLLVDIFFSLDPDLFHSILKPRYNSTRISQISPVLLNHSHPILASNVLQTPNVSMPDPPPANIHLPTHNDQELVIVDGPNIQVPLNRLNQTWLIDKRNRYLSDFRTHPTPNDLAETSLLKLIQETGSSMTMYSKILRWAHSAQASGYSFMYQPRTPKAVFDHLASLFDMAGFTAIPKPVMFLPDNKESTVWTFDTAHVIHSLLSDTNLMVEENMDFPDPMDPFVTPSRPTNASPITSLKDGSWYRKTFQKMCPRPGKKVLCPIILYSDGAVLDRHGRLSLTPYSMTLGIFKPNVRTKKEAWRHIGFMPSVKTEMSFHQGTPAYGDVQKNYHRAIDVILESLREVQRVGGMDFDIP